MRTRALWTALLLLGLCGLPAVVRGQDGATLVVADATGEAGGTAQTSVTVGDATDIGAFDLALVYDPAVIRFSEAQAGSSADNSLMEWNEIEPGRLLVAMADVDGLAGDGSVLDITFDVMGAVGDRSTVTVEAIRAYHYETGVDIVVNTANGEIVVVEGGDHDELADTLPWVLVLGCLGLLFLVGLVGGVVILVLFLKRRRRQA